MFYFTPTQFGLTFDQVRKLLPQLSLRANGEIQSDAVCSYTPTPTPDYNPATHFVCEISPVGGVQQWALRELSDAQKQAHLDAQVAQAQQQAKGKRDEAVARIRVTTASGKVFDGDETSQTRMARAVIAMQAAGQTQTLWVLADNTPATVTLDELAEALALAGAEQTRLWVSA